MGEAINLLCVSALALTFVLTGIPLAAVGLVVGYMMWRNA